MKDVAKVNNSATNPIRDVLSGALIEVITSRQIPMVMASLIPLITDVDGIDVTSERVFFNRGYFKGQAQITDTRPDEAPTVVLDTKRDSVPMKWISTSLQITRQDKDLYAKGKTKFSNKALAAMQIMGKTEEIFLKKGLTELGLEGIDTAEGVNIVTAVAKWATLTGAQILEEIRKGWAAHTTGGKFEADSFWLDKNLHDLLYKPYSDKEPKSTLEILEGRKWFKKIVSIAEYGTATIVEDRPTNFGYILDLPAQLTETYTDKLTEIHLMEEHLSSILILQPQSITKYEGAL